MGSILTASVHQRAAPSMYNYKCFYSVVLMALGDADYKFIWADVGSRLVGFRCPNIQQLRAERICGDGTLGLPPPDPVPNDYQDVPYYFLGDDAFTLRETMMKPYSQWWLGNEEGIF